MVAKTEPDEPVSKANADEDEEGGGAKGNNSQQFILQFQHMFGYASTETTYFAFSYPFSYEESTEMLDLMEEKLTRPEHQSSIYFHREVLYYSLEGRKMEIVTISSQDGITDAFED